MIDYKNLAALLSIEERDYKDIFGLQK